MNSDYIPYSKIPEFLEIKKGDILLVFADIKKLAFISKRKENEFLINNFIDSLLKKLGPEGTLLIPAFNFKLQPGEKFNIKTTIPVTGALATEALKRNDFSRTKNPLHSFAVAGKERENLKNLPNTTSFGEDSPFHILYEKKAKMLIVDLDLHSSFTFAHYVEQKENVWYRYKKNYEIIYTDENENTVRKTFSIFKKYSWVTLDFHPLEEMISPAEIQNIKINSCRFRLIDLFKSFDIVKNEIRTNKTKKIARISLSIFIKDTLKRILKKLKLFSSATEKIQHASDL